MIQINKKKPAFYVFCIIFGTTRSTFKLGLSAIKEDPLQFESQVVKHPVVQQSVDASKDAVQRSFDAK